MIRLWFSRSTGYCSILLHSPISSPISCSGGGINRPRRVLDIMERRIDQPSVRPTRREVCAGLVAWCVGAEQGPAADPLLDALDLDRPELAEVRSARSDPSSARAAFARHLRARSRPLWFFDPSTPPPGSQADIEIADLAMRHTFESVGIRHTFGPEIDWGYNPTTLPGSPDAPDHEWTWQWNRHSAWTAMARAFTTTGNPDYGRELAAQITDWIRQNPPPEGRALNSPYSRWRTIEAGIRMFDSWPEIYHRLVRHPEVFPDEALLAMVDCMRLHAEYLDAYPTGGNWLCMEANGQLHVGALFPEFKNAGRWTEHALSRLRREIDGQVYPDGVQIELTPGYHNVSLGNFVGALRLARLNGIALPDGYQSGLERMYAMNLRAMSPDRDVPPVNDSWAIDVRRILGEGLTLFPQRADWAWIRSDGAQGREPRERSCRFPFAGWAVMRSDWTTNARYLMMDCGPFGYGHQHEDKLSFVLHAYGKRFVFDAGSYAYDASDMRRYVLSARGHNVIHVDGLEQNRRGGPRDGYVVKAPVAMEWVTKPGYDYASATYGGLPEETWGPDKRRNILHRRRVLFVKSTYWIVCDTLESDDRLEHTYESTFHIDDEVDLDAASGRLTSKGTGPRITILPISEHPIASRIVSAQIQPVVQGWLPKRHGRTGADPRPCVYYTVRASGVVHLLYVFAPAPAGGPCPVTDVRHIPEPGGIAATVSLAEGGTHGVRVTASGRVTLRTGARAITVNPNPSPKPPPLRT